jgi:hypothetical protein
MIQATIVFMYLSNSASSRVGTAVTVELIVGCVISLGVLIAGKINGRPGLFGAGTGYSVLFGAASVIQGLQLLPSITPAL